jgi:hypothetical protein
MAVDQHSSTTCLHTVNECKCFVKPGEEVSLVCVWYSYLHVLEVGLEQTRAVVRYVQHCGHSEMLQCWQITRVFSTAQDEIRQYLHWRSIAVTVINGGRLQFQLPLNARVEGDGEASAD